MGRAGSVVLAVVLAPILLLIACGGGTDDLSVDLGQQGSTTDTTSDPTAAPSGDASTAEPGQPSSSAPGDPAATPSNGGSEPGDGPSPETLADPPSTTITDGLPDHTWSFFEAVAIVYAGDRTTRFHGLTPWFDGRLDDDFFPCNTVCVAYTTAGCSVIETADGRTIAQASFDPIGPESSFSMSDNGDGTVVWGYYHAPTNEEWSATGRGRASVEAHVLTDMVSAEDRNRLLWDLGFHRRAFGRNFPWGESEAMFVSIVFEGDASENFSTEKAPASSVVLCLYGSAN